MKNINEYVDLNIKELKEELKSISAINKADFSIVNMLKKSNEIKTMKDKINEASKRNNKKMVDFLNSEYAESKYSDSEREDAYKEYITKCNALINDVSKIKIS
ncbi:MAG: hypothetical protein CL843_16095 [Crocinitomicaceae bacterium]|nr:hypothetical protein [Crocinitomicaceae bacterium]|tara:strand:+ start:164 stop:472 length:309 start_codon:yes stop_codon:yes gene_type:complete